MQAPQKRAPEGEKKLPQKAPVLNKEGKFFERHKNILFSH